MIVTSIKKLPAEEREHLTVVIGGGTIGLYFAIQLCKQGKRVLVIESGGRHLDNFSEGTFESIGHPHEGIKIARSRSLGGTSNLWGGQLVEYQAPDFEGRPWLPDSKWPLPFAEIEKHYGPTYENLGIPENFHKDEDVFNALGTPLPKFSSGVEFFLTRWLKIPSMAEMFEEEIQLNPLLYVLLNHTVTDFEGADGQITGVKVKDITGETDRITGGTFILAAGTMESVRLMLHAATSPSSYAPWAANSNIGAYFQDHIGGRAASVHPLDKKRFISYFSSIVRGGFKFQPKLRLDNETLRNQGILNIQGMLHFESSVGENLVFLKQFLRAAVFSRKIGNVLELPRHLLACAKHLPPLMYRFIIQNRVFVPSGSKISFMLQSEQVPLKRSRISVDHDTRDKFGLPKLILDWRLGEEEIASMRKFTLRCKEALEKAGIAELNLVKELEESNPAFVNSIRDNYHHVGGLCMGESEEDGVVDSDLRVFGTNNLYVLGASVFRTTSNANSTFLAYTFATRLAEHLRSQHPN